MKQYAPYLFAILLICTRFSFAEAEKSVAPEIVVAGEDTVQLSLFGHGSLMLNFDGVLIYVDPISKYADFKKLPKADYILITHEHGDHFDITAIEDLSKPTTNLVTNSRCAEVLKRGIVMKNGAVDTIGTIEIKAVPAYNTTPDRTKFHPKGRDNGFVLTKGALRIYLAGDTEDIPEMSTIKNCTIAFLPVNQPYTMTPKQLTNATTILKPKILYPYHFGDTDSLSIVNAIKNIAGVELRMRDMR